MMITGSQSHGWPAARVVTGAGRERAGRGKHPESAAKEVVDVRSRAVARSRRVDEPVSVFNQDDSTRFLPLSEVAQVLAVTDTQVYALVRSGSLKAVKLGGRGKWRVERSELESFIARMYDETERFIAEHPFGRAELDDAELGASPERADLD